MNTERESLISFRYWFTWRWWFGLPEGVFVRLRCRILGHSWSPCVDECCNGETFWCGRCATTITPRVSHAFRVRETGEDIIVSREDFVRFFALLHAACEDDPDDSDVEFEVNDGFEI